MSALLQRSMVADNQKKFVKIGSSPVPACTSSYCFDSNYRFLQQQQCGLIDPVTAVAQKRA